MRDFLRSGVQDSPPWLRLPVAVRLLCCNSIRGIDMHVVLLWADIHPTSVQADKVYVGVCHQALVANATGVNTEDPFSRSGPPAVPT